MDAINNSTRIQAILQLMAEAEASKIFYPYRFVYSDYFDVQ